MKIAIVGGGPSGLYFGLLVKKRMPQAQITVYEQNRANDTFGFGVVMADTGLSHLEAADKATHDALSAAMRFSHKQLIKLDDQQLAIEKPGAGGGAIPRLVLLDILQKHCIEAGMDLRFSTRCDFADASFKQALEDADLVVGADGVNSVVRQQQAHRRSEPRSVCSPTGLHGLAPTKCSNAPPWFSSMSRVAGSLRTTTPTATP